MNFFIIGTDTGVGKTILSLLFMKYFIMNGENPFYIKPFQTGCADSSSADSDARFIYENIAALEGKIHPNRFSTVFASPEPLILQRKTKTKLWIEQTFRIS